MKIKFLNKIAFLTCLVLIFLGSFSNLFAKQLKIVVSSYPLKKIIEESCPSLKFYFLNPIGENFHFFEPTPFQWKEIKQADLLILVGTEPWAKKAFSLRKNKCILSLMREDEKIEDPHLWFDFLRIKNFVKALQTYLKNNDLATYNACKETFQKFLSQLESLEKEKNSLKKCKKKEVFIIGHPIFYYLFKDTGIKEITLVKSGVHHIEPNIKTFKNFLDQIQDKKAKVVFFTDLHLIKFKELIEQKGIKVKFLWSGGIYQEGSFSQLMKDNLLKIKEALECEEPF